MKTVAEDAAAAARLTATPLDAIIPHRAPMALIDAVEDFSAEEKRAVARLTIRPDNPFFDGEGVPAWAAIEFMAQTAAALVGLRDRLLSPTEQPRPGLLLGTRRMELATDHFAAGATYRVSAVCSFDDMDAAAFQCEVSDAAGAVVATASLNAYRPPDMAAFLKEQTSP